MKELLFKFLILVGFVFTTNVYSQAVGDYGSAATGDWSVAGTWVVCTSAGTWAGATAAGAPPTSANNVWIRNSHDVSITSNVTAGNLTVDVGGTLTLNCSATTTLTIDVNSTFTVNGTFTVTGTSNGSSPYNVVLTDATSIMVVGNGGVVNLNATQSSSTKGFIPSATWQTGSTLNINAIGGPSATGWGSGNDQNFYDINVNYAAGTANFGWGFVTGSIHDLNILQTGTTGRLQLFGGSQGEVTINNLTQSGGNLTGSGTGSEGTADVVRVNGNVSITNGAFSVDRGSHKNANDGSGVKWYFYGDNVTIAPTSTSDGMANSNSQKGNLPYALDSRFIMAKAGAQNLRITPALCTSSWGISVELINSAQVTLTAPSNIIRLILTSGNIIAPTASPLIMGWDNAGSIYSGVIADLNGSANANSTNNVIGNLGFLVGSTSSTTKDYPISKGGIYRPLSLSINPSTATTSIFYAEIFNSAPPANTNPGSIDKVSSVRYYSISESAGGSAFTDGAVTVSYDTDDGVTDAANLRVAKEDGAGNWVDLGGTGSANTTGTILSTTSFASLSNFVLANATGGSNPLPVELTKFSANLVDEKVTLNWETATEVNNYGFEIQRQNKNSEWKKIGFVEGHGNSNSAKYYSFTDDKIDLAGRYLYRLKQIDNDGTYEYSDIVEINLAAPERFELSQNYPNPFNPSTEITYSLTNAGNVRLIVYNIQGEVVKELLNEYEEPGFYSISFNGDQLSSGIYYYKLISEGYQEIKKMMLLK